MDRLQQQHHVEDVGRILLQTQEQLRAMREHVTAAAASVEVAAAMRQSGGGGAAADVQLELGAILQRAELELQTKAELVLNGLVHASSNNRDRDGPGWPSIIGGPLSTAVAAQALPVSPPSKRERGRLAPELDVDYFRSRFRNPAVEILAPSSSPSSSSPSGAPTAVAQRQRDAQRGRRIRDKTAAPARLLPGVNRRDPGAAPPELRAEDARRGVLDLLTRGFLPPHADLTPAFAAADRGRGVLQNARTRLHDRLEAPARPTPACQPSGFNVAALKFDLAPPLPSAAPDSGAPPTAKATTLPRLLSPPPEEQQEEKDTRQQAASRVVLAFQGPSAGGKRAARDAAAASASNQREAPEDEAPLSMEDVGAGGATEELGASVDKIRGYASLLDGLALHQFAIARGRAARASPEFAAFRWSPGCADAWGAVEQVVRALEALLALYSVPLAHVDGAQVLRLARSERGAGALTRAELLGCVLNGEQVARLLRRPGQRFKGKDRRRRAAGTLQSALRMLARRRAFRRQRARERSAELIQRRWRVWLARARLLRELEAWRRARDERWGERMRALRSQWARLAAGPRVIVHVPSLSGLTPRARLSVASLGARQNLQLARVAALAALGPGVEVVYVAPFELPADVAAYALRLLELAGVRDARARVRFLAPEQAARLPAHLSLASLLLYSPKCLARIRRATRGKTAYLVAGHPGGEDRRLAQALDLPLLGGSEGGGSESGHGLGGGFGGSSIAPPPALHVPLTTRSGAKRAFLRADVNVPFGAVDLFDEHEVALAVAKLLVAHLDFAGGWALQLDVDPLGGGRARVDASALATVRDLRRESATRPADYWRQPGVRDAAVRQVLAEIERKTLARVAAPVDREAFPRWTDFSRAMAETGVVVEAEPPNALGHIRANLFIEPQGGAVHVASTHDVLFGRPPWTKAPGRGVAVGYAFPQSVAPPEAVEGAASAVARCVAKEHGAWGYLSVDFVLFRDERAGGATRMWATALHPFLTDAAASFAVFRLLTHASAVSASSSNSNSSSSISSGSTVALSPHMTAGDLLLAEARAAASATPTESAAPSRCYVVSDYVFHPGVATMSYSGFFHACRLHGVCLDVERALGTVFLLTDSLAAGMFGVLSVSESRAGALAFLRTALEAIAREVGTGECAAGGDPSEDGDASGNFAMVLTAIRALAGGKAAKLGEQQRRGRER